MSFKIVELQRVNVTLEMNPGPVNRINGLTPTICLGHGISTGEFIKRKKTKTSYVTPRRGQEWNTTSKKVVPA